MRPVSRVRDSLGHGSRGRVAALVSLLAVFVGWLQPAVVAQADPASTLGVTVTAVTSTGPSGSDFTFAVNWSCSSTAVTCDNGVITVPLPKTSPDGIQTQYKSATASSTFSAGAPTVAANVITWRLNTSVPAGQSGSMTFTVAPPNFSTPDGSTISPVATFSATGATSVTATASSTVTSSADLVAAKARTSAALPALDTPVTYRVSAGHTYNINLSTASCGGYSFTGVWAVQDLVVVDHLPAGAVFVSATESGVYDSATNSVTWPAVNENGGYVGCTSHYLTLTYPSTVFSSTDTVTNRVSVTAQPWLRPDEQRSASGQATHGFAPRLDQGSITKGPTASNATQVAPGGMAIFNLNIFNTGNTPLALDLVDLVPCQFTSPTDVDSTACASPYMKGVSIQTVSASGTYAVEYTSNLGTIRTTTIATTGGTTMWNLPVGAGEWVTKLHITANMAPGDAFRAGIFGTAVSTLPTTAPPGTTYQTASFPTAATYVENCLASASLTATDGTKAASITSATATATRCGYQRIVSPRPTLFPRKSVTGSPQNAGGELTFGLALGNYSTSVNAFPVMADLLPTNLAFVPGSVTYPPMPITSTPVVTVIDNYNGTGRQMVRFAWPDETVGLASGQYAVANFKVRILPGTPAGTYNNVFRGSDAHYTAYNSYAAPTDCHHGDTRDVDDWSGNGVATDWACAQAVSYTVVPTSSMGVAKSVKGSLDSTSVTMPQVGTSLPGSTSSYSVDVTNTGTVSTQNVVAYDLLPRVGDTGVGPSWADQRGSQFGVTLNGPVTAPGAASVEYTTAATPCRGDVIARGGAIASAPVGCVNDWSAATPTDWSAVTGVRVDYGSDDFAPGETRGIGFSVDVPLGAHGTAWNNAAVGFQRSDTGTWQLPVEAAKVGLAIPVDLSLAKTVTPGPYAPGDTVTYTVGLTNAGPGIADVVTVRDKLPNGVTFVSASTINGSYVSSTGLWTLADAVPVGGTATLTLTAKIDAGTGGSRISNTAQVQTSDVPDLDSTPGNSVASEDDQAAAAVRVGYTIGDTVWNDLNSNGSQDPGEAGLPGVTAVLKDMAGAVLATAITDADGHYLFDALAPGDYTVNVDTSTLPPSMSATYDLDGGGDSTVVVHLGTSNVHTADFGFVARVPITPAPTPASTVTVLPAPTPSGSAPAVGVRTGIPSPGSGSPWMVLFGVLVTAATIGASKWMLRR